MTNSKKNNPFGKVIYQEKLYIPIFWYFLVILAIYPLYYTLKLRINTSQTINIIVFIFLLVFAYIFMFSFNSKKIRIYNSGILELNNAIIETKYFTNFLEITKDMKSNAMGKQLNPQAFVNHHFWVKTMVLLTLNDPNDKTPYWLISTRNPKKIVEILSNMK